MTNLDNVEAHFVRALPAALLFLISTSAADNYSRSFTVGLVPLIGYWF